MAIVIFFTAYVISSLSRCVLTPFIGQWPILGNAVIYTAILVVSLIYFALPIGNRLLRHWLYRQLKLFMLKHQRKTYLESQYLLNGKPCDVYFGLWIL